MVHVYAYIINVFPSIIAFLYRYLRSDDNALFIYCHITIKVGKKLANIYGRSFSIITFNCTYIYICFQLLLFTISKGDDSMNSKGI